MLVSLNAILEPAPGKSCRACGGLQGLWLLRVRSGAEEDTQGPFCLTCWPEQERLLVLQGAKEQVRPPQGGVKKRSRRQEEKIAHDLDGRAQPNSGALSHAKGDIRKKGRFRVEAKYTAQRSYSVRRDDLDKIRSEALYPEKPAFVIEFMSPAGTMEDSWVLIPYADWLDYTHGSSDDK